MLLELQEGFSFSFRYVKIGARLTADKYRFRSVNGPYESPALIKMIGKTVSFSFTGWNLDTGVVGKCRILDMPEVYRDGPRRCQFEVLEFDGTYPGSFLERLTGGKV